MLYRIYFFFTSGKNTILRMKKKLIIFRELLARMISTCYYFKNNLNKRGEKIRSATMYDYTTHYCVLIMM